MLRNGKIAWITVITTFLALKATSFAEFIDNSAMDKMNWQERKLF